MSEKIKAKIFLSYAHDDKLYFQVFSKELRKSLNTSTKFDFTIWEDKKNILVGLEWNKTIKQALKEADIGILLVSNSFFNSEYIKEKEFKKLFKKTQENKCLLFPVYFGACNINAWEKLAKRQFYKPDGENYGEGANNDFSFFDLVDFFKHNGLLMPNSNIYKYLNDLTKSLEASYEYLIENKDTKSEENNDNKKKKKKAETSKINTINYSGDNGIIIQDSSIDNLNIKK
ncbi:MAG: hypothetical protein B6I24_09420 [Bacteroidetes bacterium 4572_128]|nr:MAG: hypothetical protein B6I24_09420 [Bacteroidetes bacterium 4572_128]